MSSLEILFKIENDSLDKYTCLTVSQISLALGIRKIKRDNIETTMGIEVIQQSSLLLRAGLFLILVKTLMMKRTINSAVLIPPAIPTPMANFPKAVQNRNIKD